MSLEEVLGKFISHQMMVMNAKYINDVANGSLTSNEPQIFKVTNDKETLPSKVAQVEAVGLNDEEMALVIKHFKNALKGHKDLSNKGKSRGKCACFKCGKTGHFIANYPDNENDQDNEKNTKGKKVEKKKFYKKKGETHRGEAWDLDCSSSDSDNEGLVTYLPHPLISLISSLNEHHTSIMAKEKVFSRDTPKYTSSSHDDSIVMKLITLICLKA
jgi:hypothetical protein